MMARQGVWIALGAAMAFCSPTARASEEAMGSKPVVFGVVADVQYADMDAVGRRHFREAEGQLRKCVADLNGRELDFVIQVGDVVEEGEENLEAVLGAFEELSAPKRHVLGNHDFVMPRERLLRRLGMERGYYSFSVGEWLFLVLDCQDIGLGYGWGEGSERERQAKEMLAGLEAAEAPNAVDWNGGIGAEQKAWVVSELKDARERGQRAVVFGHMPLLAEACRPEHLLWNHGEMLEALEASGCVVAYFSGHDHAGGYGYRNGIHHVTMEGMVEAPEENAYGVVRLYDDRIELEGVGRVENREMGIEERP